MRVVTLFNFELKSQNALLKSQKNCHKSLVSLARQKRKALFEGTRICFHCDTNPLRRCCHFANLSGLRSTSFCHHYISKNPSHDFPLATIIKILLTINTGELGHDDKREAMH